MSFRGRERARDGFLPRIPRITGKLTEQELEYEYEYEYEQEHPGAGAAVVRSIECRMRN